MPEYRLSLDFTAADDAQATRLAEAWAGTCAAEYGTRMAGFERLDGEQRSPFVRLSRALHFGRDGHGGVPFDRKDTWRDGYLAATRIALREAALNQHANGSYETDDLDR